MEMLSVRFAVQTAELLSFRQVAAANAVRPSAISRRIRALEDELGVSLFERHAGGVNMTLAGREFVRLARSALAELDFAARSAGSAGSGATGRLRIGIFASIASGPGNMIIRRFVTSHPSIIVDLVEAGPREHIQMVKDRQVDVSFVTGTPVVDGCDVEKFWDERVFVALPAGHALTEDGDLHWTALKHETFIVSRSEPGPEIHDYVIKRLADLGYQPVVHRSDVGRESLMAMVGLNIGLSLISEAGTGPIYPGVTFKPVDCDDDILPLSAIWLPQNDNPAMRRFLSLARSVLKGKRVIAVG
jgi:DNA-binding transcriptional LysR family regulator